MKGPIEGVAKMLQAVPNPAAAATAAAAAGAAKHGPVIPVAVLDNLAARFRPSGLCLLMLAPDGSLVYHDGGAGLFFQRFAIPMIQYPSPSAKLAEKVAA